MKFILPLHRRKRYQSLLWFESEQIPGVRYAIRRISLGQRLELARQARALSLKHEFLRSGNPGEQLEASLSDLLVARLYLEWGLAYIEGLAIDGKPATPQSLIDNGPEALANEILHSIRSQLELSEDERKNS
jgi:hypothetical protein